MARILVQRAARASADAGDLRLRLAEQIPGEEDRRGFLASGGATGLPPGGTGARPRDGGASSLATSLSPSAGKAIAPDDPRLAAAERLLAAEVGPLAKVLVRRAARAAPSWEAFAEAASAEVPDASRRSAVRSAILAGA